MRLRRNVFYAIAPLIIATGLAAQTVRTLTNGNVYMRYQTGVAQGMQIMSISDSSDPSAGFEFVDSGWVVNFRDSDGSVTPLTHAETSPTFSVVSSSTMFIARWANCVFSPAPGETLKFRVTVRGNVDVGDKMAKLTAEVLVLQNDPGYSIESVDYPRLAFKQRAESGNGELALPQVEGMLVLDPVHNTFIFPTAIPFQGPGRFYNMQFLSYCETGGESPANLFLGTRDNQGHNKVFYVGPAAPDVPGVVEALPIRMTVHPQGNFDPSITSYTQAFPFVLGVLRGDWYSAAKYYRSWILDPVNAVPWAQQPQMWADPAYSDIIRDSQAFGVFIPTHCCPLDDEGGVQAGPTDNSTWNYLLRDINDQKALLGLTRPQDKVALHIAHWDNYSLAAHWGEWLPIPSAMTSAISSVADNFDIYFNSGVYSVPNSECGGVNHPFPTLQVDGNLCEVEAPAIYDIESMCIQKYTNIGGVPTLETQRNAVRPIPRDVAICTAPPVVCPSVEAPDVDVINVDYRAMIGGRRFATDYAQHYLRQFNTITGKSPKGIYLDFFIDNSPEVSYNPLWPTGGGSSWTGSKLGFISELRDKSRECEEDFYVLSEGLQEMYLGKCEITLVYHIARDQRDGAGNVKALNIPLFQTVYHDYQIALGGGVLGAPQLVVSDEGTVDFTSSSLMRLQRQLIAVALDRGYLPAFGSTLSEVSLNDLRVEYPEYEKAMLMYGSVMLTLRNSKARDFTIFGEKMRNPKITGSPLNGAETDFYIPGTTLQANRLGDYRSIAPAGVADPAKWQPFVYASLYRRENWALGRPALGIQLINWTYSGDYPSSGTQTVNIEVKTSENGLSGKYELRRVNQDNTLGPQIGTINVDLLPPGSNSFMINLVTVDPGNAKVLLLLPIP